MSSFFQKIIRFYTALHIRIDISDIKYEELQLFPSNRQQNSDRRLGALQALILSFPPPDKESHDFYLDHPKEAG